MGTGFSSNNAGSGFTGSSNLDSGSLGMVEDLKAGGPSASPLKPPQPMAAKAAKPKAAMPPPAAVSFSVKEDDYGASKKSKQASTSILPQGPSQ